MVEKAAPESDVEEVGQEAVAPPWMTILHNCDCHTFEQVVEQLQKAIGCSESKGWELAWQVHNTGKAVVKVGAETEDVVDEAVAPPWMTILHNCECHTFEQVVKQLQKAIACSEAEGWEIAWQVHNTGKAVVKIGPEAECVRVGNILASIGLIVTVVQS